MHVLEKHNKRTGHIQKAIVVPLLLLITSIHPEVITDARVFQYRKTT